MSQPATTSPPDQAPAAGAVSAMDSVSVTNPVSATNTVSSAAGVVKWYSLTKGYGFIESEHEGKDQEIFVHYTDVTGEALMEGESVRFEVVESPKGLKARNVTRADDAGCY